MRATSASRWSAESAASSERMGSSSVMGPRRLHRSAPVALYVATYWLTTPSGGKVSGRKPASNLAKCRYWEIAMGLFTDLLKDFPALAVARERIELAEAKQKSLEEENERLKNEVSELQSRVAMLQSKIPDTRFVEFRGVLFKRQSDGRIEEAAYCPDCKRVMSSLENMLPFCCSKCDFVAPFKGTELKSILAQVTDQ
jgi:hypothetical protein